MQTATAFQLFAIANKVLHDLKLHVSDDLLVMKQKFAGIPVVSFLSPLKGIACALFYFDKYFPNQKLQKVLRLIKLNLNKLLVIKTLNILHVD
jgi:hypothetical protein